MFKNRYITYIIILVMCISFTGCAGLQRKFTRKKKKEIDTTVPVVTTYDYSKELRVEELYKKHFLFWKTWQSELIDRMDSGYKKRSACYDYTIASLMEMEKYLTGVKAEELGKFIKEVRSVNPEIKEKTLSKGKEHRIRQVLEKTRRQIEKRFSYPHVKDFLELKNSHVD